MLIDLRFVITIRTVNNEESQQSQEIKDDATILEQIAMYIHHAMIRSGLHHDSSESTFLRV